MSDVFYKTQKKNQEMRHKHQVQCGHFICYLYVYIVKEQVQLQYSTTVRFLWR